jgi:hypothetical protein
VLDHLGEQRHFLDRAQRILLLALHQRVDARDQRFGRAVASSSRSRAPRQVVVADLVAAVAVELEARAPGLALASSATRSPAALVALEEGRALGGQVQQHSQQRRRRCVRRRSARRLGRERIVRAQCGRKDTACAVHSMRSMRCASSARRVDQHALLLLQRLAGEAAGDLERSSALK